VSGVAVGEHSLRQLITTDRLTSEILVLIVQRDLSDHLNDKK